MVDNVKDSVGLGVGDINNSATENENSINTKSNNQLEGGNHKDSVQGLPKYGVRHLQVFLLFNGLLIAYALRVNLSVGIVAMVDNSSNLNFAEYNWNEKIQGLLLSSFFWGYIFSQFPAGLLAQRFGPRILLLISSVVCSALTLLTPLFASFGWQWLCVARVIQGVAQGLIFPCTHTLLAKWVHTSERGFLTTFTYSGTQIGTVLMLAISGVIASSAIGWPGIFYCSGSIGIFWSFAWFWYGSNTPSECAIISKEECAFLESSPGQTHGKLTVPWRHILKSKPFYALLIAHCAQNWGFWTLLTEIPSYMKNVLDFDIKSNALLSALPYLVMWILSLAMSELSDFLMNRSYISVGNGRKLFNTIGSWIPVVCLISLGYVPKENSALAVFLLTVGVGINSGTYVGYMCNHIDLSPNFAGTLMGMTNCLANVMSLIGPLFVGFIVTTASDPSLWRIVFFVTSGFFFCGNLIFVIFGRGKIQYWNDMAADDSPTKMGESTVTVETVDISDVQKAK